jgi:hypothetical protein
MGRTYRFDLLWFKSSSFFAKGWVILNQTPPKARSLMSLTNVCDCNYTIKNFKAKKLDEIIHSQPFQLRPRLKALKSSNPHMLNLKEALFKMKL